MNKQHRLHLGMRSEDFSIGSTATGISMSLRQICYPYSTEGDSVGRRRRGRSNKEQRRIRAADAQRHLSTILQEPEAYPEGVVESAAVHLVKTSRRHRLPLPTNSRELVCRACWAQHVTSSHFRVRIKHGQRIKTCLKCGTVRRFGGGPKHHRILRRN